MFIEIEELEKAFHIPEPWYIDHCKFNDELQQLDVFVKFRKRGLFACSGCGTESQPVYDTADENRTWRHLNFLEYPCYIHAELPRTKCNKCNTIKRVHVPWAIKPRHNFTLYFDALIMTMAKDMPMNAIARFIGEHDTRLWRILHYYVKQAVEAQDLSHVTKIGTDETSSKRGHNYVTIFMDADHKVVICATEGKNAQTVKVCKEHLETHGGHAENIKEVCIDMSPAFIKGFEEHFPNAAITFDKFHVIKNVNEAVDDVRRNEQKTCSDLKYTRYIWLKNEVNLTAEQKRTLDKLKDCELQTTKAYRMKICLQELFRYPSSIAPMVLQDWIQWGLRCRLEPMVEVAQMIQKHYQGIIQWFTSKLNNGLLEGVNSLIQAAKRKARGYRSVDNLIAMIYLIGGKLRFDYPTLSK